MDALVTREKLLLKLRTVMLNAPMRNRIFLAGDLLLIFLAVLGSFALRFELGALFVYYLPQALRMAVLALLIKPVVYHIFGLYRRLWAYASTRELTLIITAVTSASIALSAAVLALIYFQTASGRFIGFPRATLVIDWLLSIILAGGLRFSSRLIADSRAGTLNGRHTSSGVRRV